MLRISTYCLIVLSGIAFGCTKEKIVPIVDQCQGKADSTGLTLLWDNSLPHEGFVSQMKVTEHGVFVIYMPLLNKNPIEIILFDSKTGDIIWKITSKDIIITQESLLLGDYFYYASQEKLLRLDIKTGQVETVFTNEPYHFLTVIPNTLGNSIFLHSEYFDKNTQAYLVQVLEFNTESLEHRIIQEIMDLQNTLNNDVFRDPVFANVNGTRIMCFSRLNVTNNLENLTAVNIDKGDVLWEKALKGLEVIKKFVLSNTHFSLLNDDYIMSIEPLTGKVNWKIQIDKKGGYIHFVNNSIFYLASALILKIDPSTGVTDWEKKIVNWSDNRLVQYKDQVYFIGPEALEACEFSGGCSTTRTLDPYFDNNGQRGYFTKLEIDQLNGILLTADNAHIFGYLLPN